MQKKISTHGEGKKTRQKARLDCFIISESLLIETESARILPDHSMILF